MEMVGQTKRSHNNGPHMGRILNIQKTRHGSFFSKTIFAASFLFSLFYAPVSCSNLDTEFQSAVTGIEMVEREYVVSSFETAILINGAICPENQAEAYYAREEVVRSEVRKSIYVKSTADNCQVLLLATPCGFSTREPLLTGNLYRSIIRTCGLQHGEWSYE